MKLTTLATSTTSTTSTASTASSATTSTTSHAHAQVDATPPTFSATDEIRITEPQDNFPHEAPPQTVSSPSIFSSVGPKAASTATSGFVVGGGDGSASGGVGGKASKGLKLEIKQKSNAASTTSAVKTPPDIAGNVFNLLVIKSERESRLQPAASPSVGSFGKSV